MIAEVVQLLDEQGDALGLPRLHPGLVIGIDADPAGKVTMLLLDGDGRPRAVAKVGRRPGSDGRRLTDEHAALVRVRRHTLARTDDTVPRPLILAQVADRPVLVTSVVTGAPLSVRYYRPGHVCSESRVRADFDAAADWLAAFHSDMALTTVSCEQAWHDHLAPLFARYRAEVGWSDWEAGLYDRMLRWVDDLRSIPIPVGYVHGDYCIGNVLLCGAVITGVVDWELGREPALALTDVFKFAASYGSFLDRAAAPRRDGIAGHPGWAAARRRWGAHSAWPNLAGFVYAFRGAGWFPEAVRDYLAANYQRMGLPEEVQPLFLTAFVAEQVLVLDNPVYRQGYRDLLHALADMYDDYPARRPAVAG
jgi:aminoglycoside phosphotransferase (APT) family kinase protein